MAIPPLFQPLQIGRMNLEHRVVMAPLTRLRANDEHVHTDLAVDYYRQRASTPGTFIIAEATLISQQAGGFINVPGIYNQKQIDAWKRVTDAVHKEGSYIYLQLWALGRVAKTPLLEAEGLDLVSSGDVPMEEGAPKPRPLSKEEIQEYIRDYEQATKNAMEAGFDGVELHVGNGYLADQFLEDTSNNRTDEYGGCIENRARFPLEIMDVITKVAGQDRVGFRITPYSPYQGMRMDDPIPQFTYLVRQLARNYPNLAYLHSSESRASAWAGIEGDSSEDLDFIRSAWGKDRVFLRAGGYDFETASQVTNSEPNTAIVVGRHFISNPDLPRRWKEGIKLEPYDRNLFYNFKDPHGYTDYKPAAVLRKESSFKPVATLHKESSF